jgi:hypothetical protein
VYMYKAFLEIGVLMVKFSGDYFKDEANEGLLNIARSMNMDEKFAITTVILDLNDVTSMTLANTDRARVYYWEREIFATFDHPEKDAAAHLQAIKYFNVLPENRALKERYLARLLKVHSGMIGVPVIDNHFNDLADLLQSLDLLELLPLLADGWREI